MTIHWGGRRDEVHPPSAADWVAIAIIVVGVVVLGLSWMKGGNLP